MKRLTIAALAVSVLSLVGAYSVSPQRVEAQAAVRDCSANSVVKCGVSSAADLVAKIKANNPNDLQAIYSHFKLTPDRYDAFVREAKMGMAYQNGDIKVDGQVVARDAWSIGREQKSYSTPYKIGDTTLHRSESTEVLRQDLPVIVWFNERGLLEIAVLAACGNPMGGSNVSAPSSRCNQLKREKVEGQENTYRFTTNATAANGATISRVVYNFGDGSNEQTVTTTTEAVTHTYDRSGTFTAKVTVYVKLPGGREVVANGNGCAQRITIAQPRQANWECTSLRATSQTGSDEEYAYTFRANTTSTNASLSKADFDFGDGNVENGVRPAGTSSNNVSANHSYANPGAYKAVATVYFEADDNAEADADNADTSVTCEVEVTVKEPVTPAAVTPEPAQPAPQPELPKTGAAGLLSVFTGASALGTMGYRWNIRRRQSKIDNLIDSLTQK